MSMFSHWSVVSSQSWDGSLLRLCGIRWCFAAMRAHNGRLTNDQFPSARTFPGNTRVTDASYGASLMPTGRASLMPALRRVVLAGTQADRTDGQLLGAFVADRDADAFGLLVRR